MSIRLDTGQTDRRTELLKQYHTVHVLHTVTRDKKNHVITGFGVVAEVREAGVEAPPRADVVVCGVDLARDTRRPRPPHALTDIVVLAVHEQPQPRS